MRFVILVFSLVIFTACGKGKSTQGKASPETRQVIPERPEVRIVPDSISMEVGEKKACDISIDKGQGPYKVEVISGDAEVDGRKLTIRSPKDVSVQVIDANGTIAIAKVRVQNVGPRPMKVYAPKLVSINEYGELTISGAVEPVRISIRAGKARVEGNKIYGRALGVAVFEVTDGLGRTETDWMGFYKPFSINDASGTLVESFGRDGLLISTKTRGLYDYLCADRKQNIYAIKVRHSLSSEKVRDPAGVTVDAYTRDGSSLNSFELKIEWDTDVVLVDDASVDDQNRLLVLLKEINEEKSVYSSLALFRFGPDGKPDLSFNDTGKIKIESLFPMSGANFLVQSDGRIIISGYDAKTREPTVQRLLTDGSSDLTFGKEGKAVIPVFPMVFSRHLAFQIANGDLRIIVAGLGEKILPDKTVGEDFVLTNRIGLFALTLEGKPDVKFGKEGLYLHEIVHRPYGLKRVAYLHMVDSLLALPEGGLVVSGSVASTPYLMMVSHDGSSQNVAVDLSNFTISPHVYLSHLGPEVILMKTVTGEDYPGDLRRFRIVEVKEEKDKAPRSLRDFVDGYLVRARDQFSLGLSRENVGPHRDENWWTTHDNARFPLGLSGGTVVFGGAGLVKFFWR